VFRCEARYVIQAEREEEALRLGQRLTAGIEIVPWDCSTLCDPPGPENSQSVADK
jgi:hypothetical protein